MGLIHTAAFRYYGSAFMAAWLAAQLTSGEPDPQPVAPPQMTAMDGLLLLQEGALKSYQAALQVLPSIEAGGPPDRTRCAALSTARAAFRVTLNDVEDKAQSMRGNKSTEEDGRYLGALVADIRQRDRDSSLAQIESLCAPR